LAGFFVINSDARQAMVDREEDQFESIGNSRFGEDVGEVMLHCLFADRELNWHKIMSLKDSLR
jgi:hypothetical protein